MLSDALRNMYESEADHLLDSFHKECVFKERVQERRKTNFNNILHASNLVTTNNIQELERTFLEEREDFSNNSIDYRERMRDSIVNTMSNLFKEMQATVDDVQRTSMSEDRVRVYEGFVRQENEFEEIKEWNFRETAERHRQIIELQMELQNLEHEVMLQMNDKRCERDYFVECFQTLRSHYNADMKMDDERIRQLVDESHKTIEVNL